MEQCPLCGTDWPEDHENCPGCGADELDRDLHRMSVNEAKSLVEEYGTDVLVAKPTAPDSCEKCKELFLGQDGEPKVFRLSTLLANGTNAERNPDDWKPVVSIIHQGCLCIITRVPPGWGFKNGDLMPGMKSIVTES